MTKKEKIKILKGALAAFEDPEDLEFLCTAIARSGKWFIGEGVLDLDKAQEFMSTVGINKPKGVDSAAWYGGLDGRTKRISLLNGAIKRLKTKKK